MTKAPVIPASRQRATMSARWARRSDPRDRPSAGQRRGADGGAYLGLDVALDGGLGGAAALFAPDQGHLGAVLDLVLVDDGQRGPASDVDGVAAVGGDADD